VWVLQEAWMTAMWWLWLAGCTWVTVDDEQAALEQAQASAAVPSIDGAPTQWDACSGLVIGVDVEGAPADAVATLTPYVDGREGDEVSGVVPDDGRVAFELDLSSWVAGPRQLSVDVRLGEAEPVRFDLGVLSDVTRYGYADLDGDGHSALPERRNCEGLLSDALDGDCDDTDPTVHPDAVDAAGDGIDADCDGIERCYVDVDGDGFAGDTLEEVFGTLSCSGERLHGSSTDCADDDAATYPGALEICDGVDNDCDGVVPADEDDDDADGFVVCTAAVPGLQGGDCDDAEPGSYPGAPEIPADGIDSDCDGLELCYGDGDGDGRGAIGPADVSSADLQCGAPGVAAESDDCDDTNALVYPEAPELCDGQVNACSIDELDVGTLQPLGAFDADGQWMGEFGDLVEAITTAGDGGIVQVCDDVGDDQQVYTVPGDVTLTFRGPLDRVERPVVGGTIHALGGLTVTDLELSGGPGVVHPEDGDTVGGGMAVFERVLLERVKVHCFGSGSIQRGGGLFVAEEGLLTATDVEVVECSADDGGGLYNQGSIDWNNGELRGNTAIRGGAVANQGDLIVIGAQIEANEATGDAGGLRNLVGGGMVVLEGVSFVSNVVEGNAVADLGVNGGTVTLQSVTITPAGTPHDDKPSIRAQAPVTADGLIFTPAPLATHHIELVGSTFDCTSCTFEATTQILFDPYAGLLFDATGQQEVTCDINGCEG
jgi:hypothetical protein